MYNAQYDQTQFGKDSQGWYILRWFVKFHNQVEINLFITMMRDVAQFVHNYEGSWFVVSKIGIEVFNFFFF